MPSMLREQQLPQQLAAAANEHVERLGRARSARRGGGGDDDGVDGGGGGDDDEEATIGAGLAQRLAEQHAKLLLLERDAEQQYQAKLIQLQGTSSVTARRVAARALLEKEQTLGQIREIQAQMEVQRRDRLALYRRQASSDRVRAIETGRALAAKEAGRDWVARAKPADERRMGPAKVPRSMAEATSLLARFPAPTPYEAGFLFVMALYRLRAMRGAKSRHTTMAMLRRVLHPDCFLPPVAPGEEPRLRKHVLVALERGGVMVAASFVEGATPFNMYNVVPGSFAVRIKSSGQAYRNAHDARFHIELRFSGAHHCGDNYRSLGLRYIDGRGWAVDSFTAIANCLVCEPFSEDADSVEEYQREQAYREEFRLPKMRYAFYEKAKTRGYKVPRSYNECGLERVDLDKARRLVKAREEEALEQAAPAAPVDAVQRAEHYSRSRSVTPEKPVVPPIGSLSCAAGPEPLG